MALMLMDATTDDELDLDGVVPAHVEHLQDLVRDLRRALMHQRAVTALERQRADRAEEQAHHAWRVAVRVR